MNGIVWISLGCARGIPPCLESVGSQASGAEVLAIYGDAERYGCVIRLYPLGVEPTPHWTVDGLWICQHCVVSSPHPCWEWAEAEMDRLAPDITGIAREERQEAAARYGTHLPSGAYPGSCRSHTRHAGCSMNETSLEPILGPCPQCESFAIKPLSFLRVPDPRDRNYRYALGENVDGYLRCLSCDHRWWTTIPMPGPAVARALWQCMGLTPRQPRLD